MLKYDSKPIQMLSRIVDMIVLNLITILCSFPLLTIGAARSALLYCLRQMRLEKGNNLTGMYFSRFRQELKKSTILWLVYVAAAVWMVLDIYFSLILNLGTLGYLMMAVFAVLFLAVSFAYHVGMGLNCFFENSAGRNLWNGMLIGLGNFPTAFFITLLEALPWLLLWFIPESIGYLVIVYSMIGISMTASLELTLYRQLFRRFLPEEPVLPEEPEDDYEYDEEEEAKARFDFRSLTDTEDRGSL